MSDALKRLIETVGGGEWDGSWRGVLDADKMMPPQAFSDAYHGSLDASRSVHDALLPGWTACIGQNAHHNDWNAFVRLTDAGIITREHWGGTDDNGARAWLLAILRAKLAEAEHTGGEHE